MFKNNNVIIIKPENDWIWFLNGEALNIFISWEWSLRQ